MLLYMKHFLFILIAKFLVRHSLQLTRQQLSSLNCLACLHCNTRLDFRGNLLDCLTTEKNRTGASCTDMEVSKFFCSDRWSQVILNMLILFTASIIWGEFYFDAISTSNHKINTIPYFITLYCEM